MRDLRNSLVGHPLIVTFVFITLCLLPVMIMRDFSPDNESRYLLIADEAIQNGNIFAFTLDGQAYADKPPLYLWIVMLCKILLGKHSMFLLSLFGVSAGTPAPAADQINPNRKKCEKCGDSKLNHTSRMYDLSQFDIEIKRKDGKK